MTFYMELKIGQNMAGGGMLAEDLSLSNYQFCIPKEDPFLYCLPFDWGRIWPWEDKSLKVRVRETDRLLSLICLEFSPCRICVELSP